MKSYQNIQQTGKTENHRNKTHTHTHLRRPPMTTTTSNNGPSMLNPRPGACSLGGEYIIHSEWIMALPLSFVGVVHSSGPKASRTTLRKSQDHRATGLSYCVPSSIRSGQFLCRSFPNRENLHPFFHTLTPI